MEDPNIMPNHHEAIQQSSNATGYSDLNADMDIDMDIDLGVDPEVDALEAEAMAIETGPEAERAPVQNGNLPSDHTEPVSEKVHIRGLDSLTTADVKAFASRYFSLDHFVRVEWIDDTSANIVYNAPDAALEALAAFSDFRNQEPALVAPLDLRPAKELPSHPGVELHVRQAIGTDVKKPRAHEASRFYLLNPDKDPRERRRQNETRGGRGREGFRRHENKRRRVGEDAIPFDESMYDDDIGATTVGGKPNGRRRSLSNTSQPESTERTRRTQFRNRGEDLFADRLSKRNNGRLRNRSASPDRDGDDRLGFDERTMSRRTRERSEDRLTHDRQRDGNMAAHLNGAKELFPSHASSAKPDASLPPSAKELFPVKSPTSKRGKELFPNKTAISNHRRTVAFDAANEKPDLFSPTMAAPSAEGISATESMDLADRMDGADRRKTVDSQIEPEPGEFSVRGTAEKAVPGFSIRGAANSSDPMPPRQDLFSKKSGGNVGKELFAEKIRGRGGPRRKAQDMFF